MKNIHLLDEILLKPVPHYPAGDSSDSPHIAKAAQDDKVIKIGLVGIGGRGSGAAAQAMNADPMLPLPPLVTYLKTGSNFEAVFLKPGDGINIKLLMKPHLLDLMPIKK